MRKSALALFVSTSLFCFRAFGQQEGIPTFTISGSPIVGYANNGAGFAFSPLVSLAVTALGFNGSDLAHSSYRVSLFNAVGTQLATAQVSTGSPFYNQTYYQGISAVNLTAGNTYYLGAVEVGGTNLVWAGNVVGAAGGGTFSVNPDITYVSGNTGFMPPGSVPGSAQGQNYFVGANFEFTVVPEPASVGLLILGAALFALRGRGKLFAHTR